MKKVFLALVFMSLLVSGCTVASDEKIRGLESELGSLRERVDLLEQKQVVIESNYNELMTQKKEVAVSAVEASMTNQDIQTALKNAGFYSGSIDGTIGPETTKAIKAFQESKGLKVDGVAGAKTKSLLAAYLTIEETN
ncbi:MAG: peptidoglycan-binding domain-containing protein [Candidatus Omnitrophota bacterium]